MGKREFAVAALAAAVAPLAAQAQGAAHSGAQGGHGHSPHATVQPNALRWTAPPAYARGAQLAVLHGDPSKEGMYVVRLRVPAGFRIPAHTHPNDENVTVLSGSFNVGTGDRLDESRGERVAAGGYSFVGKGMTHYAWFTEDTDLQLHGMGPQGIRYVNPADDPRNQ